MSFKLLVVEDVVLLRKRLVSAFSEIEGVRVVGQTGHARQAVVNARRLLPDAVVLDIGLTGGNGVEVLKEIKGATMSRVIMLSNHSQRPYRRICARAGADYFFDKQTEMIKLMTLLGRLAMENSLASSAIGKRRVKRSSAKGRRRACLCSQEGAAFGH